MWYEKKPVGFNPVAEISGCFIESDGEILLLTRNSRSHIGEEALPGGTGEEGETPQETILREVLEETGIDLTDTPPTLFKTIYENYPDGDYTYNIFHVILTARQLVVLSSEHSDYAWVTPAQALQRNLIQYLDVCIKMLYPHGGGK